MNTKIIYTHSNEVMRCRWSEAGKGQVREGTEKHLEGGNEKQGATHEGNIFKIKQ